MKLQLHFEPNLQYQQDAINAVVDLFEGQPLDQESALYNLIDDNYYANYQDSIDAIAVSNKLILNKQQIVNNIQLIQARNNIIKEDQLVKLEQVSNDNPISVAIEMETGTGKTYVYLRTIYELNKKYGFLKFVIVVPSIAIKEGVYKNLQITHGHFQNIYDKTPVNYQIYDSNNVSKLRSFANNNVIEILIINTDSFAKDKNNIINNSNDKLSGYKPIQFIQAVKPIVILDEPQNMETEPKQKAILSLNPTIILRYSATHKDKSNLIYSLNPVDAYKQGLVKKILVNSIREEKSFNHAFIKVESITRTKSKKTATITIHSNETKEVKHKTIKVTTDDFYLDDNCTTKKADLYTLSNYKESYKNGYVIEYINFQDKCIELSSGKRIHIGNVYGALTDELFKFQIRTTIIKHLSKELNLKEQNRNIKVLSLFFIDRVANYRQHNADNKTDMMGKFALWFEEIYQEEINKSRYSVIKNDLDRFQVQDVHGGYFSQDKKGVWKDTKIGDTKDDNDTYKLIMKEKEKLLSLDEPLRFIFSHSALREGWDNPNVFQICTLNETKSEIKKRQEIGRGLRLCVDNNGNRIYDPQINILTIIANEFYDDFAKQLQDEIEQDYGIKIEKPDNDRKTVTIQYRKGFELDPKFVEIWDRIKFKTKYQIYYKTDDLINKCVIKLKKLEPITPPILISSEAMLRYNQYNEITAQYLDSGKSVAIKNNWNIPDILGYIQKQTELTRDTIYQILLQSDKMNEIIINPQLFLDMVSKTINTVLSDLMISGIKYEKINNNEYIMLLTDFQELDIYFNGDIGTNQNNRYYAVNNQEKTIYSTGIPLDSNVEYDFAKDCENSERVKFYFKLPSKFKIPTPVGSYNPDWAVVLEDDKKVYFVVENKKTNNNNSDIELEKLRLQERQKIECGREHFKQLDQVNFEVVSSLRSLLEQD